MAKLKDTEQAIGLFDSGIGGLTVLDCVQEILPAENLIYMADSAHAPYGDKTVEYICERSQHICDLLIDREVKAIVIACNTATAAAASFLREQYTLPIIAMEPGVKPALALSISGVIGVLATVETAHSKQLDDLVKRYAGEQQVLIQACPGLVELIEAGESNSEKTRELLKYYLQPLLDAGVDTLVLGCSHYPLIHSQIQALVGEKIQLVETGAPVARELQRRLEKNNLLNNAANPGQIQVLSSAPSAQLEMLFEQITSLKVLPERFE